ncbi:MAG: UdgX family uracil-DNA binding protein [Actinomycetota bacterium]
MAPTKQVTTAAEFIPAAANLTQLKEIAAACTACELYKLGTQTVFGEGKKRSEVMFVGEQPGDKEDLTGRPFVGPAGRLLDEALEEVGIDRGLVYITNVVKHFKWEARGKRRIHKKPKMGEVTACKPWLEAELDQVKPQALICLGSTAAQALLGRTFKVTQQRGELVESPLAPLVTATVHPSSILRERDDDLRRSARREFVRDLEHVAAEMKGN